MRWFTHKAVALSAALTCEASLPVLGGVLAGSILPDAVDMAVARRNRSLFQRIHRGTTHWPGWYLLLLVGAQLGLAPADAGFLARFFGAGLDASASLTAQAGMLGADILSGVALGGLSHLLLDALNPTGIPLSPLGGKPRLVLARIPTGTWGEAGFLILAHALFAARVPAVRVWLEALLRTL